MYLEPAPPCAHVDEHVASKHVDWFYIRRVYTVGSQVRWRVGVTQGVWKASTVWRSVPLEWRTSGSQDFSIYHGGSNIWSRPRATGLVSSVRDWFRRAAQERHCPNDLRSQDEKYDLKKPYIWNFKITPVNNWWDKNWIQRKWYTSCNCLTTNVYVKVCGMKLKQWKEGRLLRIEKKKTENEWESNLRTEKKKSRLNQRNWQEDHKSKKKWMEYEVKIQ